MNQLCKQNRPGLSLSADDGAIHGMTRSEFLRVAAAATAVFGLGLTGGRSTMATETMQKRAIPASGELLPVIGCGTWQTFDVGPAKEERAPRAEVLRVLFEAGGSVIDSSPMYGRSEQVVGDLLAESGAQNRAFIATKVWTTGQQAGVRQMQESMRLLRKKPLDLLQVHNLVDWRTHLRTLRAWKEQGLVRYLGVTHYTASAYGELEAVMRSESLDFVQLNYALDDREAERRLLPLAADRGIAVLVNQPFGGGGLLRRLANTALPAWAGEIGCESWAQILLKFVLGNQAVTCVIPGTSRPTHMADNCRAGIGPMPDSTTSRRIAQWWEARR